MVICNVHSVGVFDSIFRYILLIKNFGGIESPSDVVWLDRHDVLITQL